MKLSERGALKAAICDGGYHVYPSAKLVDLIKDNLPNEDFKGDFDPKNTVQKIRSVKISGDEHTEAIFKEDIDKLCSRLEKMNPEYKIEEVFEKMSVDLPKMAKHYFNIDNYKPVHSEVVEFFFEGYNDLYKDGDWNAFNIDAAESKEYGVPIGIYFKRSQVAPGYPEYVVMHENVHQFTEKAGMDDVTHYYIPWIMEGFADVFGYMMLYRITKDFELVSRTKNLVTEFDVVDSRKVTYHYEANIASQFISNAGLPLTKAFLKVMERYHNGFNWSTIANGILNSEAAFDSVVNGYLGDNKKEFKKELITLQEEFKSGGELDNDDKKILRFFSSTQPPATLVPAEYRSAVWLIDQLNNNTEKSYFHTKLLKDADGGKIKNIGEYGLSNWANVPKGHNSFLVCIDDIPENLKDGVEKLSNYFFIVKKEYSDKIYYDVFGGGLPHRMGTGEIRCNL